MTTDLHPTLPKLPVRMQRLPVDARGYPVPWFVNWFHADGKAFERINTPIKPGDYPDFRVMDARKMYLARTLKLCWVCGDILGRYVSFVIGPMCAVNRTSGEPPCHRECAEFSARFCPFLSKPAVERRENNLPLPEEIRIHPQMLDRNPGVAMVWVTESYKVHRDDQNNITFGMGDPVEVQYYCQGRTATRKEIMHSIDTGMPFLRECAAKQSEDAIALLDQMYADAIRLVPAA